MPSYELQSPADTPSAHRTEASVITAARAQIDQFFAEMRDFAGRELSDVLMTLAAFSAYASELRGQIQRVDSRRLTAFRTKELDPFLDECDRQFKVWSRVQSVRQMEWDASRGGV